MPYPQFHRQKIPLQGYRGGIWVEGRFLGKYEAKEDKLVLNYKCMGTRVTIRQHYWSSNAWE